MTHDGFLLGIDIGTSGCKAVVFGYDGKKIAGASMTYPLIFPQSGWMELDAAQVTGCVMECVKKCVCDCDKDAITALAVSSQGEAVIAADRSGNPLMNAIVTFDSRNRDECAWFSQSFDKNRIMRITGAPIHSMFSLTKILWIKNNRHDVMNSVWKFFCFGDYISYKLGADPVIDHSMAARTMAFDIEIKKWSNEILDACGFSIGIFPETAASGTVIGKVSQEAAELTGLNPGTVIVAGGHDQACCALGTGVLSDGMAMDSLGTTESIVCVNRDLHVTEDMVRNNLPCYPYVVGGMYAYLSFLSTSGGILKWFHNGILSESIGYADYDKAAAAECPGYSGLLLLPHFAGSGTPYLDDQSKGAIAGLTLGTSKYQIYKAVLESTCLESRLNIECMEKSGIKAKKLYCVGGGARSPLWLQLKADITGKAVVSRNITEYGCLGAAILAGMGAGIYKDAGSAFNGLQAESTEYRPDGEKKAMYDDIYPKYLQLYDALKSI